MKPLRRRFFQVGAVAALVLGMSGAWAQAQDYPSKPITLVVPFPPGGVVDIIGRLVGEKLGTSMKATVIVENRPGAGGTIGAGVVARAKPDGYTLLLGGSATHVFAPLLYTRLAYNPLKDFAAIGQISASPLAVVVSPAVQANTLPELINYLKANGSRVNYGSNGNGTFPQLAQELLKQQYNLETTHVPFGGGPAVMTALIRGDIAMSINHIAVVQGMVKSGKLKAIATTGKERTPAFPDLPTFEEAGVKGFEANTWFGLFAPQGTPQPIIAKLGAELKAALATETLRTQLLKQGEEAKTSTPQELDNRVEVESAKWAKVIKDARIVID